MNNELELGSYADINKYFEEHPIPIEVVIDGKNIGFVNQDYWIELNRIKNTHDVVEWIHHLLGKTWFTNLMCEQFIEKVYEYRKWNIYRDV